jgi:hypothetical protein
MGEGRVFRPSFFYGFFYARLIFDASKAADLPYSLPDSAGS